MSARDVLPDAVWPWSMAVLVGSAAWVLAGAPQAARQDASAAQGSTVASIGLAEIGLGDDPMLGFVEVGAGAFIMGSDSAQDPLAFDNEHWTADGERGVVDLPTYYVARHEVTVGQYGAFLRATGHPALPEATRGSPEHPVANVSWPDALAYARWLDASLRAAPETPGSLVDLLRAGWRITLPDEAQWEKAARGIDGRRFPWGDEPRTDRATFGGGPASGPRPVGSHACPECPYDVADMSGNVWEWTRSPYQAYPHDPSDDATTVGTDALWVMRGGSFQDGERNVRATVRGAADPGARRPFLGFRVALLPPGV